MTEIERLEAELARANELVAHYKALSLGNRRARRALRMLNTLVEACTNNEKFGVNPIEEDVLEGAKTLLILEGFKDDMEGK